MKNEILNEVKRTLSLMGISENKLDLDSTDKKYFKDYIDVSEKDNNPKNLDIEKIQSDWRFAKLLNTLLFEVYSDNIDLNDDESKTGIVDIHTLNDATNWSILNYFGGHKFVKQRLLDIFNKENKSENTPKDFYRWLIDNKERLFGEGPILKELVRTNMNTYNKGSITEKYVIEKLKNAGFDVKYYPPGSKYDRDYGIDIEVNGVSFQVKELTGIVKLDDGFLFKTPHPKDYLGLRVSRIMLVDISTGEYVSFPNRDYELDSEEDGYKVKNEEDSKIKFGNF